MTDDLRRVAFAMAAYMVRGTGVCEKPHRNGEANPHIHFNDDYIARARDLSNAAAAARPEPRAEGLPEALLLAVEEVDNCWTDHGDHIEWDEDALPERLITLRREYAALAATPPAEGLEWLDGPFLSRVWAKSGRHDPLSEPAAWDGFALTLRALAEVEGYAATPPAEGLDVGRLADVLADRMGSWMIVDRHRLAAAMRERRVAEAYAALAPEQPE